MRNTHKLPHIGTVDNYRHLWMLVWWVIYLILFAIVEHEVQTDYYVMHCGLDDKIPFCAWFIFPYCLCHPLLFLMTAYLAFWDAENFKRYVTFIALGFIPVILFDWAFPNGQELRPAVFAERLAAACTLQEEKMAHHLLLRVTGTFKNQAELDAMIKRSIRSTDVAGIGTDNAIYLLMNQASKEDLPLLTRRFGEKKLYVTAVPLDEQLRLISAAKQEVQHE